MESIVSAALAEICSQGTKGVYIKDLWPRLQTHLSSAGLDLCDGVKKSIWSGVLNIPGLQFKSKNSSFSSQDATIQSFEDAEKFILNIAASEHLRDCFVGLYDIKAGDAGVSAPQRRVLERLAVARTDGITQNQLANEFGIKGNNIYYVVKNLQVRGLIVRQPTIIRTKENANEEENGSKSTSIVNTNLIHLYRYAKNLNSLQKLEITKFDALESLEGSALRSDGFSEGVKDDVLIKDYVPAMKAICDKLEEADGKVLVVSDLKQALGYRKTQGHRAWRNIRNRLREARLVEEFCAEVDKKEVRCIRLIKKFDPQCVQPKHTGFALDDVATEQPVNFGKQGQNTDQLLELPIEHQIYDLIDAEGSKGMTVTEVCKRLGLDNKRNYSRLLSIISRFGMHLQAENCNRTVHYRVWTSGNFPGETSNNVHGKSEYSQSHQKVDQVIPLIESSTSKDEFKSPECGQNEFERHCSSPGDDGNTQMLICGSSLRDSVNGILGTDWDEEHELGIMVSEPISAPSEVPPPTSSTPSKRRSYPRHPCLVLTAESAQREQRIRERLQEDKFVLIVELHKWLESLEKDKRTTMDKKTVVRILDKLEQEGICRCIEVSVPLVTNFDRNRTTKVVLHNSLQNLSPDLMIKIQERLRSFDMQSRGQGLARLKNDGEVPVLTNINRTVTRDSSDSQPVRVDAMRVNGFVLAKMVRAKLLHSFLWSYLSNSPDWSDAVYSGKHGYNLKNPHSSCKLFTLSVAVKAMPFELFLQVVGSTQLFDNLVENCKLGLCLADLPSQEYTCLMNIQATRRLSSLVDVLCRLKLMRLVTDKDVEDREETSLAIYTYAMELKPYIEEPLSKVSVSLGFSSHDLRPRIRHDFILSNKEAVDIYWKTLEYCYATADAKAAVHAFPGSSVHEVFRDRSWASVRVMTADQRAELLKRIVCDDPDKKISFSDCVKIAKDLNLTVEQVLRVSNDKRQSRLNRYEKDLSPITSNFASASRKRKRSKATPSKRVQPEELSVCSIDQEDHDVFFEARDEDLQETIADDLGLIEQGGEEDSNFIGRCALKRLKPSRRERFSWTETSDRQLVIQYVKNRAVLGPKYHRTEWVSLPDLPASPGACRRRMHIINNSPMVLKAVLRLCTLLGDRYARHLIESQEKELLSRNSSGQILQKCSTVAGPTKGVPPSHGETLEENFKEQPWDDFEDEDVKVALSEVLRCKQLARQEFSRRSGSTPQNDWRANVLAAQPYDAHEDLFQEEREVVSRTSKGVKDTQAHDPRRQRRASCHRLPGKFLKLLNEGISVSRRAYESLAVANAVELLKLVFLSTSLAPEVPNLLAETLRRYSEHDLFAAFNYLREKRFMVGGNGSQPFVLSQQFLHNVSSSPFPTNTGKRALKFVNWLREREQDLMEDEVCLNEDLQCGDIFHLLALVSSCELLISPTLPDEGIGEADENNTGKRKRDNPDEICSADDNVKRFKSVSNKEGEVVCRRAKGFPGIKVSVSRVTISQADAIGQCQGTLSIIDTNDISSSDPGTSSSQSVPDIFGCMTPVETWVDGSTWQAMTSYGNQLLEVTPPLTSDLFKTAHSAISRAGDQGLSLEQISELLCLQGREMVESIVDVLQVFGVAVKVNAYDDVRTVDASFRHKYFLTTIEGRYQALKPTPPIKSSTKIIQRIPNTDPETVVSLDDVHKVTLLNLPEEDVSVSRLPDELQTTCSALNSHTRSMRMESVHEVGCGDTSSYSHSFRPILPWINGDGTTNPIVYKGLVRRVLGIVMQNPGILEDEVIYRMDVLNPQSCKKLLELMILDNQIIVRKMNQSICNGPPSILGSICGMSSKILTRSVCRDHLFGNPTSAVHL
ncbi:hypothetical protein ACHQM5_002006 [Ranunculus cassubicifolius]